MPHYVVLGKWTEEGARNVRQSPQRRAHLRAGVESIGGKLVGFYYTMGEHDFVAIVDLPSDQAALAGLLDTAREGSVRTATLRAFTEDEFDRALRQLPE